jgi:hypothetical protein
VIAFRHVDARFPFLWESELQPEGRWHAEGQGPVQYFADTPDGAWAELLRHEEIRDEADLATIRRALWAVELPDEPLAKPVLPPRVLRGGRASYAACQEEARRLRARGAKGLVAPSAALHDAAAGGWRVAGGLKPARERSGKVIVLFGRRPDVVGWSAAAEGRPHRTLFAKVRHFVRG